MTDRLCDKPRLDHLEWCNRVHAGTGRLLRFTIDGRQVTRGGACIERGLPGDATLIAPALIKDPPRTRVWRHMPWIVSLPSNLRFTPYVLVWSYPGFPAGIVVEPTSGLPVRLIARPTQERILLATMETIAGGEHVG